MAYFLLVVSVLLILSSQSLVWWCGRRVLMRFGNVLCDIPGTDLRQHPGGGPTAGRSAASLSAELHRQALASWRIEDFRSAATRAAHQRFAAVVPPLSIVVLVLGTICGRIRPFTSVSLFLAVLAAACVVPLISIATELAAASRTASALHRDGSLTDPAQIRALSVCLAAQVWLASSPPVLAALAAL